MLSALRAIRLWGPGCLAFQQSTIFAAAIKSLSDALLQIGLLAALEGLPATRQSSSIKSQTGLSDKAPSCELGELPWRRARRLSCIKTQPRLSVAIPGSWDKTPDSRIWSFFLPKTPRRTIAKTWMGQSKHLKGCSGLSVGGSVRVLHFWLIINGNLIRAPHALGVKQPKTAHTPSF